MKINTGIQSYKGLQGKEYLRYHETGEVFHDKDRYISSSIEEKPDFMKMGDMLSSIATLKAGGETGETQKKKGAAKVLFLSGLAVGGACIAGGFMIPGGQMLIPLGIASGGGLIYAGLKTLEKEEKPEAPKAEQEIKTEAPKAEQEIKTEVAGKIESKPVASAPVKEKSVTNDPADKEKVLFALMEAENSNDDAMCNLRVIEGNQKSGETLKEAADEFIRLLNFESNDKTDAVRSDFKMIGNSLKTEEKRKDAVETFIDHVNAESGMTDARNNYLLVDKFVTPEASRKELTKEFLRILSGAGNDETTHVQNAFSTIEKSLHPGEKRAVAVDLFLNILNVADSPSRAINAYKAINECLNPGEDRKYATEQFIKIAKAENDTEQATGNYIITNKYVTRENPRNKLADQFVRLLNQEGNDETDDVRSDFKMIAENMKKGEKIEDSMDTFFDQINAESGMGDARNNYLLVDKFVTPEASRKELTKEFLRILNGTGNDETTHVQNAFSGIEKSLRPGERRADAVGLFIDILNAADSPAKAVDAYKSINEALKSDEDRKYATEQFIKIAKAENDTDQARVNYLITDKYITPENPRNKLADQFVRLLNQEGDDETDNVRSDFKMVAESMKKGEKIEDSMDTFFDQINAESSMSDARGNYVFLDQFVTPEASRKELTKDFLRILNGVGNDETTNVRNAFSGIEKSLRPGEDRKSATEQFLKIARAEDSIAQAIENYNLVNQYVTSEKTRGALTDQFINILNKVGSGETAKAQSMFKQINQ